MEGTYVPLVEAKTFDYIQNALQEKAFRIAESQNTSGIENILKGKVICGHCGSKMQRRRGTNHADWYFFTCLTNNRVGAEYCTGMYVREEDIFRAIYYQLKLFLDSHFISRSQYETEKDVLEQQIADYKDILANSSERAQRYYEQLVMKDISQSEYIDLKKNVYEANERMNACTQALEQHAKRYQQFIKMRKVKDNELPLSEIIDLIEKITVSEGRQVEVTWEI